MASTLAVRRRADYRSDAFVAAGLVETRQDAVGRQQFLLQCD
ncbi:MAG: hypothetical protein O7D92_07400 [Proteobacteria bacterium]|nr:hypothetical protein [Pseudomonadota bacterium]